MAHQRPLPCPRTGFPPARIFSESSSTPDMLRFRSPTYAPQPASAQDDYTEELWHACAGPLVSVPKVGQRVWYFPQGHMEQVAASTGQPQGPDQQMPHVNLQPQIPCRVMHLSLSAEADTDEVYAQLTLLPEPDTGDFDSIEEQSAPPSRLPRMFTKVLTASDTSTHGGFSVLRKHAEDCLPPLDMSQDTPTQELVATDLHGAVWRFRHTYRGHPRRHLLTTGWSHFVSQKKLVAGDAVVFLRGENGELRVGIRRSNRQQPAQSSNVLTSHSMHMGVIATAAHAVMTRTMFSVYYKPRASPSPFIVPMEKLSKSLRTELSVGMRFKMKFEGEDAAERSYTGTITGFEDLNPAFWPNSKWRSLRVNWDEMSNHEQRERVSPWEIELCVHSQAPVNSNSMPNKNKRLRPTLPADLGNCGKAPFPPQMSTTSKYPVPLPGQEPRLLGDDMLKSHPALWAKRPEDHGIVRPTTDGMPPTWLVAGSMDPRQQQQLSLQSENMQQAQDRPREDMYSFFASTSGTSTHDHMLASMAPSRPSQGAWQPSRPTSVSTTLPDTSVWPMMPMLSGPPHLSVLPQMRTDSSQACLVNTTVTKVGSENRCKLFGFSLTEPPKPIKSSIGGEEDQYGDVSVSELPQPQQSTMPEKSVSSDAEYSDSTGLRMSKDGECRSNQSNPPTVRSCTKVIKKGSMVGRGVDLSKFDNYKKLIEELEVMFHIEGELSNPDRGWQVAYSDDEGDMMHVGDDPWTEFCSMVRKIYIFSPEEVRANGLSQSRTRDERQSCGRDNVKAS